MSNFSVKLNASRPCRYVFEANLWETRNMKFGLPVTVLLDTGAYNTVIHKALVENNGVLLKRTMPIAIGGYRGDANLCVLQLSRLNNRLEATEQFSEAARVRKYPYRHCFDNKGRIMAFQEWDN